MITVLQLHELSPAPRQRKDLSRAAHGCAVEADALVHALKGDAPAPKRRVAKRASGQPYLEDLAAGRRKSTAQDCPAKSFISITHLRSAAGAAAARPRS